MIKNLNLAFIAALSICVIGLILSAFSYDAYVKGHPEVRQRLTNAEGNPQIIRQVCNDIHLPALAQSMSFFVPSSFIVILGMGCMWAVSLPKRLPRLVRILPLLLIAFSSVVFVAIQLWEPDFAYVLCGLV